MSDLKVTLRGTEAERERERITRWDVTRGERSAEIMHEHGTNALLVREKRDESAWYETRLDFNAALDVARVLLAEVAT